MLLRDVAEIFNGKTPAKSDQRSSGHPVFKVKDALQNGRFIGSYSSFVDKSYADKFPSKFIEDGDILILNAAHHAEYVASKIFYASKAVQGALATGEWLIVRVNAKVALPRFIYYWLKSDAVRARIKFIVKGIHLYPKDVSELTIDVPALPEQRRLVDILDRATAIDSLRLHASAKASEVESALFMHMFGNPATNPKGWALASLGDICAISARTTVPDHTLNANDLCIGADAISSGDGKLLFKPYVKDVLPISGKYRFQRGDILYSKIRPYLKKAWLAAGEGFCSADIYPLSAKHSATPEYLRALLLTDYFTDYAVSTSSRVSMPKINRDALFRFTFPLPPEHLLRSFSERFKAIASIKESSDKATVQASKVTASLFASVLSAIPKTHVVR